VIACSTAASLGTMTTTGPDSAATATANPFAAGDNPANGRPLPKPARDAARLSNACSVRDVVGTGHSCHNDGGPCDPTGATGSLGWLG